MGWLRRLAPPDSVDPAEASAAAARERDAALTHSLFHAMSVKLTVWMRPDGTRIYWVHCAQAPGGCEARLRAFAKWMVAAARHYGVDPFLIAGIAMRESAMSPDVIGKRGSAGVLQLHPRGIGARVPFVSDPRVRRRCLKSAGACQGQVIDAGTEHLADWLLHCGDLKQALTGYNTGRCGETGYARRVLQEMARFEQLAAQAPAAPIDATQ